MNPVIIWWIVLVVFIVFAAVSVGMRVTRRKGSHRFIEMGAERDEFFATGDPLPHDVESSDNDD